MAGSGGSEIDRRSERERERKRIGEQEKEGSG